MKPCSEDLPERVAAACAEAGRSVGEVALQFRVSVSFIHKLRRRQRTTGTVAALAPPGRDAPPAHCSGPHPASGLRGSATRCDAGRIARPTGCRWRPRRGPHAGLAGVTPAGLAAQKKSVHAAERDTGRVKALRQTFLEALADEDARRFKFVDETSVNLTYTRRYGRAAGGVGSPRPCRCATGRT